MSSPLYSVRIPQPELDELRRLANDEGVELSTAMRRGARMYLSASPEEREAYDTSGVLKRSLNESVELARVVLRELDSTKGG